MYAPAAFAEDRIPVLHAAMRAIGFTTLVSAGEHGPEASHLPLLLNTGGGGLGVLEGHFARANTHWKSFASGGGEALAIYTAANAYISPSWYPSKAETGKVVPTWNYLAIHAHGTLELFDDAPGLIDLVTRLTQAHEAGRAEPWAVSDAPADYVRQMVGAIVGFRLTITRLEGTWKMSQNRPAADQAGVRAGLAADHAPRSDAVAAVIAALPLPETLKRDI
jgi:transcriptional regulator